ncbi:MAG: B12-binding domain-containing radical SAM protein [Myxococcales bacterium]|nr:B12-binding domain-containing radical SAM protein [Myxococcales bacterium]
MADLLVAHSLHLALDPQAAAERKPHPPLGTLVTAAELEREGHDVAVYDGTFGRPEDFEQALAGHRPRKVAILADPHNISQKMCLSVWREAALVMVGAARGMGADVLVAGPDVSDHPDLYRGGVGRDEADPGITVVEGEHDTAVAAWAKGDPVSPGRRVRSNLAGLPFPAWSRAPMDRYAAAWRAAHGHWELNVSTARGCPYRCNWCAKPTWGRRYTVRPADEVWAEIMELRERYRPDRLWFTDDIFAIQRPWLARYAELAASDPMPFRCLSRADLLTDPEAVKELARAGAVEVWLGAESGSDAVLNAMDKDGTVDEIRTATRLLRKNGIRTGFFLQLGYPGERYEDVMSTVRMVRDLRPDEIGVSVSYPLPGTVFWDRVMAGRSAADAASARWAGSMENRVLFASPLNQGCYDAAREVMRAEHALARFAAKPTWRGAARVPWHLGRWPAERMRLLWGGTS